MIGSIFRIIMFTVLTLAVAWLLVTLFPGMDRIFAVILGFIVVVSAYALIGEGILNIIALILILSGLAYLLGTTRF